MRSKREAALMGTTFAFVVLAALSIAVIMGGHTPEGKANEWINNDATLLFVAFAMPIAGVSMALLRRLQFGSVVAAWLLNAIAVAFVVWSVCSHNRLRMRIGTFCTLELFMMITFFAGYGIPQIFKRKPLEKYKCIKIE